MCNRHENQRAESRPIVGQFTFGELFELPRVAPIRPDVRECADCGRAGHEYVIRELCKDFALPLSSRDKTAPTVLCHDCDSEHFADCHDCGELLDSSDCKTSDDGDDYCESCYDSAFDSCDGCSEEIAIDDCSTSEDGERWCHDCYSERFTSCEHCGSEIEIDSGNEHYVESVGVLCSSCFGDQFTSCDSCGETIARDEAHSIEDSGEYCESCYCDNSSSCEDCGDIVHCDNIREGSDGCYYCSDCIDEHTCDECEDECECSSDELRARAESRRAAERAERERRAAETLRVAELAAARAARRHWQGAQFVADSTDCAIVGSHRTFATEIETADCPGHEDFQGRFAFNCEVDGSISGEEFPSAVLHDDAGLDAISDFLAAANDAEWSVDSKCGTHTHFGVADLSVEQLKSVAYAFKLTADLWRGFVSSARRGSTYCAPIKWSRDDLERISTDEDFVRFASAQSRYQWVNWAAYVKTKGNSGEFRKTVENRLHGGTLNASKIRNWIVANVRLIEWAKDQSFDELAETFDSGRVSAASLEALLAIFPAEVSADLRGRYLRFNPDSELAADIRAASVPFPTAAEVSAATGR